MGALDERDVTQGVGLREAKAALRRRVLALQDAMTARERALASEAVTKRLLSLPSLRAASRPLLILSFRNELDTSALAAAVLASGKELVLPRVDLAARMLSLHRVIDLATEVAPGYSGIREPVAACPRVDPGSVDWVLVPGVAFTRDGRRLGYGGGFYDRLLPLLPAAAPRIAAAYALQIVDAVPTAPHDTTVDLVVTESETVVVRR